MLRLHWGVKFLKVRVDGREFRQGIVSRRTVIGAICVTIASCITRAYSRPETSVIAGAIRWDAWYGSSGHSKDAQTRLSTPSFFYRAPKHCDARQNTVVCTGTQNVMDAEIRAASEAGLSYWAFVWTPESSDLHRAFSLYQSSVIRNQMRWCAITSLVNFGSKPFEGNQLERNIKSFASYLAQPNYQRVANGRPLIFLNWSDAELASHFDNNLVQVQAAFRQFKSEVKQKSGAAPYIVIMAGHPDKSARILELLQGDAISNYIPVFKPKRAASFQDLSQQAQEFWREMVATGKPVIVDAIAGWDTRPRQAASGTDLSRLEYYQMASSEELRKHIQNAVRFTLDHPASCQAQTILIYSWDECDEGGGVLPTIGDPDGAHLRALAQALRSN